MGGRRGVNFSEDILSEIFCRLPLKSVFRFKCVSKSWFSLISDPLFIHGYTCRASLQPTQWTLLEKLFHIDEDTIPPCHNFLQNIDASRIDPVQPRLSELAFRSPKSSSKQRSSGLSYEIVAISNGFLLCRLHDDTYMSNLRYCMINPITWQCIELPQLHRTNAPVFAEGLLTQVDQELGILQSTISFGADERIHWYHRCSSPRSNDLVAYDPLDDYNSCRVTRFPELGNESTECVRLLDAFEGRLRCIRSTERYRDRGWEVWTLMSKFEEGGWTLVHRINAESVGRGAPIQPALNQFLPISNPADPNIFYFGSKHDADRLVSYNIKTGNCKLTDRTTFVKFDMNQVMQRKCPLFVLPLWPFCFRLRRQTIVSGLSLHLEDNH